MIRIRPYKDADEESVLSWCKDEHTYTMWTAGILGPYPVTGEGFKKTGGLMRFTAIDEKEPVGFFTARNPSEDLSELRFGFIIVSPAARGRGVGREMLRLGLKYAFGVYGASRVTLGVFRENLPANACYRAAGFEYTGESEIYVIGGREYAALDMECKA